MTNLQSIHRIVRFAIGRKMLGSAVVLLVLAGQVIAQTSATDTRTPAGLTPGSPSGTYALSEFDNVNLYTGGLSFHVPLLKVGGRGGASYTMTLPIEQVWRVNHDYQFAQHWPNHNWWTGLRPGYGPGVLQGRQTHEGCGDGGPWPGGEVQTGSMTTLTFTAPDGTEYELRDELTGGNRLVSTCCCYYQQHANGASRGTVFKTFDGSAATFISDTTIYDWSGGIESGPHMIYPSGHLILRDGTRYRIESGQVIWIRDRNGNKLTFQGGITDSNGRTITVEQNVNDPTYGLCDRITFKGAGGATRRIWITKTTLANVLRNTRPYDLTTPQTYAALFDYLTGSSYTQHNPSGVISSVVLPDGRRYQFFYNTYSELARVVLPTGGAIEYDWDHGGGGNICGSGPEIQRHVTERRVYADGTTLQGKITYEGWDLVSRDANGTAIARSKHYFHAPTMACPSSISHNQWNEGKEYQTEEYTANGATLLKRINHTWQQTAPSWHSYWTFEAANNPKLITTQTTIEPNGANVVTKTTAINPQTGAIGFDQYNNQTDIWEYDFGVGAVGALLRHTHTDFLTVHPVSGSNYAADANIHLRGLPMQTSVYDANGIERARTTFEYDNYASDTNHAPLVYRPNISGFDSAFSTSYVNRGNVTATTNYLLTNGSVTGSISSFVQYDMAGNSVKAIDPRGYATSFDFTDRFGAPDGEARGNAGSAELNAAGQYSYAFPTLVTNALGHTAYVQFDYYIGQPVDGEDQNGVVSSGYFNDALDRPTQIIRAANQGASVKSQTTFSYDDANRVVTTTSDQNTFGDNLLKSQIVYDGLGRTTDTRQYESVSAHITVRQTYDALGRGYQTSNPFRAGESIVWTTTAYDPLSRIITVTTPDNAVVATSYWGNTVTVTDQAGKQRKSQTDGLGRLVHVYEDPNGLNYITSYAYDSLDNLTNVYQGSQTRTFVYDSLKRLASATNPESGTIGYQYDNNGNLTQKTDARGIVSTYAYDALNRNISVNYSDTTVNPDITRHYDNPINHGKGRYWHDYFYKDDGTIDHQAVDGYDALGRPWVRRQVFYSGGQWYHYETRNTYNLAGQVISQQYPSSHVTNYQYDNAGRLSSFIGNLGDGTQRTYANGLSYSSFGGLTQEQFGMQTTALYHKLHYNVRGQLYDVRVSTFSLAQNEFDWNRGCLAFYYGGAGWGQSSTANNGNISAQQHWAPLNEATTDYAYTQNSYSYDSLNRLSSVSELHGGPWGQSGTDYSQVYNYDRYGNRTINNGATWGAPNPQFGVDIATNRLTPPGGYSMNYDAAGNLTNDTYTGQGARTYDAENRMTQAWSNNQSQSYSYDADGHRARRKVNNIETWQVYGIGGELLAEYAPAASAATPQKEYGYRNGELLITAAAGSGSSGSGLRAQYFDTMNFTDLKVTRTDPAVDFDWGGGSPDPSVGVDTFTARWSGKVEPQYSQAYTFYTWTDDGVR
ncbi:MAG: PA14 domain-containing protein, partial [Acidobacteriota bacterium]